MRSFAGISHISFDAFLVLFVVKSWLICGYDGLTMVYMLFWFYLWLRWFNYGKHAFFGFICSKTMVNLWLRWFNYGKHAFLVLFVVKPWLICGYGGLTMVNMLFWFYL